MYKTFFLFSTDLSMLQPKRERGGGGSSYYFNKECEYVYVTLFLLKTE